MSRVDSQNGAGPGGISDSQRVFPHGGPSRVLHSAWQVSIVLTITAGIFHLINLVGPSRGGFGPLLMTPFRIAFLASWALLVARFIAGRRRPRLDLIDGLVAALAVVFLLRGIFVPETLGVTINLIVTGAGVFYLVKHGAWDKGDLRLIGVALAAAVVAIGLAGIAEYAAKKNPLFDSIQVDVIGADAHVAASKQFYRIRSFIGHPGFVGAVLVGGAPLVMLALWRRRVLLGMSLVVMSLALFLSFSRGSWLLAALFLAPALLYRGRHWLKGNAKWLGAIALIGVLIITVDYVRREEVSARLGKGPAESGLHWKDGGDGPFLVVSDEAEGVLVNKSLYFEVDDDFYQAQHGSATVTVHYFDRGAGALRLEYDSWGQDGGGQEGAFKSSTYVNKTGSGRWMTATFFLENPRFDGRLSGGADFRILDDDKLAVIDRVALRQGKPDEGVVDGQLLTWTMDLDRNQMESGLSWIQGRDGPYTVVSGPMSGVQAYNKFLYFDVDDAFYRAEPGSVTVSVHYLDQGTGAVHIDYDSWNEGEKEGGSLTHSGYINKTDTGQWTTAAFYLENARFDGRLSGGADFRIADDDNLAVFDKVVLQKGKLKLPTVISEQWISRAGSFATRMDLYPFAWSVLKDHPLGVCLFNAPGTNHHAVDSLPLTWIMEFGWLALPLLGLIGWAGLREGLLVYRNRGGLVTALYASLMLLLLHGGHLMILYDKPSLVLFGSVGALYTLVRPWRRGGAIIDASSKDVIL